MNQKWQYPLRAYIGGTLISALGDQVALVGVAWAVLHLTGSYVAMGSVFASEVVARLLFSLIGGGLADLVNHRRLMIALNGLRIVIVGLVALALWNNLDSVLLLMGLAGALGMLDSLYIPTSQAFLPLAVPRDSLMAANSWLEMGNQLAMFVGPALDGLVVAWKGLALPFALDSVSYAAAIIGLMFSPIKLPLIPTMCRRRISARRLVWHALPTTGPWTNGSSNMMRGKATRRCQNRPRPPCDVNSMPSSATHFPGCWR